MAELQLSDSKRVVLDFYREVFWEGDITAIERFAADDVTVHAPVVGRGPAALRQSVQETVVQRPRDAETSGEPMPAPALLVADGDLVAVAFYLPQPEPDGSAGTFDFFLFDVLRVRDGLIVERWPSIIRPHPPQPTWSPYADGVSRPSVEAPRLDPETSKRLAVTFYREVFDGEDAELAACFVTPGYHQHSRNYPQGREGLLALLREIFPTGPRPIPETMSQPQVLQIAEGDIVVTGGPVSQPDRLHPGATYPYYIFTAYAIRDGLLAEHWSGVSKAAPLHRPNPS